MSSTLMNLATQITRVIFPIIIVLGIIANSLNVIVLRRANLKSQSGTLYFLALSINNILYSCTGIMFNFLQDGLGIDLSLYSDFSCKLVYFLLNFEPNMSLYMLVLASIDRYFCSSLSTRLRRVSSVRTARWSIFAAILFDVLFFLGNVFMVHIDIGVTNQCISDSNLLVNKILVGTQIIVYVFIAPCLMVLFGLLTIHNINQLKKLHVANVHSRPTEKQLTRMLIVQVSTHIILSLPFSIVFFMLMIPTPILYTEIYGFIYTLSKIPFYIDFITPFFLYILSAKLYRREFMTLIQSIFRIQQNAIVHPGRT